MQAGHLQRSCNQERSRKSIHGTLWALDKSLADQLPLLKDPYREWKAGISNMKALAVPTAAIYWLQDGLGWPVGDYRSPLHGIIARPPDHVCMGPGRLPREQA